MNPFFTVVMPSYLGEYKGAAKDREMKIGRAIRSLQLQTFTDWELVVVADGCHKTMDIVRVIDDERIRGLRIAKAEPWCPGPRNTGIRYAGGRWIAYLDTDDVLGTNHLQTIHNALKGAPDDVQWAWMDAWWLTKDGSFAAKRADINKCAGHGTANIVHRNNGHLWPTQRRGNNGVLDYGTQDCAFVDLLKRASPGLRIEAGEYCICHIPPYFKGAYDV